jgi:hypothetical protein
LANLLELEAKSIFETASGELTKSIPDLPTVELMLTLAASDIQSGGNHFRSDALREIELRSAGETLAGARWLMTRLKSGKLEAPTPRVLLSILKETVLRPTYLPWRSDLEQVVDAAAFDQIHRRDELSLLSDDG